MSLGNDRGEDISSQNYTRRQLTQCLESDHQWTFESLQ